MPTYNNDPDLIREIKDIRDRLDALEKANPLEQASIGKGGLTINQGGKLQIIDENGNMIVDMGTSQGLRRPWFPYHLPIMDWTYTTNGTFTSLAVARGWCQHPFARLWINTFTASDTIGEYRVGFLSDGFNMATAVWQPTETIPLNDGGTGHDVLIPSAVGYSQVAAIFVQARRVSGTGNVGISVQSAYGTGG